MRALSSWSARRPRLTLGIVFGVSAVCAIGASKLQLDGDYAALLPEDAAETHDFRYLNSVGGAWYGIVAIDRSSEGAMGAEAGLAAEIAATEFAARLGPRIERLDDVDFAEDGISLDFFEDRALLYMSLEEIEELLADATEYVERERARANPFYVDLEDNEPPELVARPEAASQLPLGGTYESADGRYQFIVFRPSFPPTAIDRSARLFDEISEEVAACQADSSIPIRVRYAGPHYSHLQEDIEITDDLGRAGLLSLCLVALLILVTTRRPRALVVILVPVLCGILFALAFAYVAVGRLNVVTGFLVPILFGLGIDFGIHMFQRFADERDSGVDAVSAAVTTSSHTGRACLTAALTTTAAFIALTFADFRGFSEFGLVAAVGLMAAFGMTVVLFPALVVILEQHFPWKAKTRGDGGRGRGLPYFGALLVVTIATAWAISGAGLVSEVGFETDLEQLRGQSEALEFDRYIDDSLGGVTAPVLLWVDGEDAESTVRQSIDGLEEVGAVVSLRDLVPDDQNAKMTAIRELQTLLSDPRLEARPEHQATLDDARKLASVSPFTTADLPTNLRRRLEVDEGLLVVAIANPDIATIDGSIAWAEQMTKIRESVSDGGGKARILSGAAVSGRLFQTVVDDGPWVLLATLGAVFLMLWVDTRRLSAVLWIATPLVGGLFAIVSTMALMGIEVNIFNALIFPSILGIGVDNAVHMWHAYRNQCQTRDGSLRQVLRTTGRATAWASLTTAAGFGTLITAHHRGVASIGVLALLGVATMWLMGVVVLGAGLRIREGKNTAGV